jgi:hypothetical protein
MNSRYPTHKSHRSPTPSERLLLELYQDRYLVLEALFGVSGRGINKHLSVLRMAYNACPVGEREPVNPK